MFLCKGKLYNPICNNIKDKFDSEISGFLVDLGKYKLEFDPKANSHHF